VGGAMSGYWEMGKDTSPNMPSVTIMIDTTVDNTGRSINLLSILFF